MKACIIVVLLLGVAACSRQDAVQTSSKNRPSPAEVPQPKSIVYPYSVVPGGVRTREDVENAIQSDSQTALHYAGINVATLQPVTLRTASRAYVSFRKKGIIYWTRKPISLPAGERLLSNGRDCIRQRCGNRVSVQPQKPVLPEADREISSGTLNTPQTATGLILEELLPAPPPVTPGFASPSIPSPMLTPPPEVTSTGSLPGILTGGAGGGGIGGGGGTGGPGTGSPGLPGIILPTSPQAPQLPGTTAPPTTPTPVYPVVPVGPTTPVTPTPPVTITFEFPPVTPPAPLPPTVFPPSIPPGSTPPPTTVVIVFPPPPGITPPETPPGQPTPPGTPPVPPMIPCCTTSSFPPPETPPGTPPTPAVPEPASLILMSAGLLVVAGLGFRKLR